MNINTIESTSTPTLCNCMNNTLNNFTTTTTTGNWFGITQPLEKSIEENEAIISAHGYRINILENDSHRLSNDIVEINNSNNNLKTIIENLEYRINNLIKEFNKLQLETENNNNKENNSMKDFMNFKFGKVTSDDVRMSMYGIAVKNIEGRYVSWDVNTHSVMDVEIMNMPSENFLYMMPVAIKDVKAGDVVIHNRVPMFVVEVHTSTLKVVDIREGSEKEIYLTKNMFNFNFVTKVVSLWDMMDVNMKPSEDNPFGNIGLMMMMMNDDKTDNLLPLILMNNKNDFTSNPMMLYYLMKDGKDSDMLPLMMMMSTKKE